MKKLICIAGPVGSGKTKAGVQLARQLDASFVDCEKLEDIIIVKYPDQARNIYKVVYNTHLPQSFEQARAIRRNGTAEQHRQYNELANPLVTLFLKQNLSRGTSVLKWKEAPNTDLWQGENDILIDSPCEKRIHAYNENRGLGNLGLSRDIVTKRDITHTQATLKAQGSAKHCILNMYDNTFEKSVRSVGENLLDRL